MLNEQNRLKLDNIVSQMQANNEPDENIQFVVDDFKSKYDEPENVQPQPENNGVMSGLKSLIQGTKFLTPQESARNPKGIASLGLNVAQLGGQMALPLMSGITTTPLTEYGIQKLQGVETPEALKQAGLAGATDLALTGAVAGGAKLAKKVIPKMAQTLAGVPKENTETAIKSIEEGKSIFNKNFKPVEEFTKAGEKAQKAVNNIVKEAGQAVHAEKEALKNVPYKLSELENQAIINQIDTLKAEKQYGRISTLNNRDLAKIDKIQKQLMNKDIGIDELYGLKKNIDELVSFSPNEVKKISDEGAGVLKQIRGILDDKIKKVSPKYAETAKKYAAVRNAHDNLINVLKGEKEITEDQLGNLIKGESGVAGTQIKKIIEKSLKNPDEIPKYFPTLKSIDDLSPANQKFIGDFENIIKKAEAKKQFDDILPQTPVRSRIASSLLASSIGAGMLGGAMGYGSQGLLSGAAGLGVLTGMSPRAYKGILTTGAKASSAYRNPAVQGVAKQTGGQITKKIMDLLNINNRSNTNGNTINQ